MNKIKIIIILFLVFKIGNIFANELSLDIYGLSYHYKVRKYINSNSDGQNFNEQNPGLGLRYGFLNNENYMISGLLGFYKDSMLNTTKYIGAGYRYKVTENFLGGFDLGYFDTISYDEHFFPVPTLTYQIKGFGLNLIWIPSGKTPAFGLSLTIPIKEF